MEDVDQVMVSDAEKSTDLDARAAAGCSTSTPTRRISHLKRRCSTLFVGPFELTPSPLCFFLSHHHHTTTHTNPPSFATAMPRSRPRPSKLALTLSLFFLQTVAISASSSSEKQDSWRPDNELPGAKFVLGDGKNEGSKVKGYEGEWPLWASFRESKAVLDPLDPVAPAGQPSSAGSAGSGDNTSYVCAPIGECEACPDDVVSTPSRSRIRKE